VRCSIKKLNLTQDKKMKENSQTPIHFQNQAIEQHGCSTIGTLVLEDRHFESGRGLLNVSLSSIVRHRCVSAFSEVKDRPLYRTP
jgi:hypothetical protein